MAKRRKTTTLAGMSHFLGQALGLLLALVISHLIARRLGTGIEADAFLFGRRIVTSIIETFNSALVVLFLPILAYQIGHGSTPIGSLARNGAAAAAVGTAFAIVLGVAAPSVVALLAPGFGPDGAALAARILTIFGLAVPATIIGALLSSYCNLTGRFGAPAVVKQLPRLATVLVLLVATSQLGVLAAGAFSVASYAMLGVLIWMSVSATRTDDTAPRPDDARQPGAGSLRHGFPAIVLVVGAQAGIWIETAAVTGVSTGALTVLDLSQRLGALLANTLGGALTLITIAAIAALVRRAA